MGASLVKREGTRPVWIVTCSQHNLHREVDTKMHADNIVRLHDRKDHPREVLARSGAAAGITHPTLDVAAAAGMLTAILSLAGPDTATGKAALDVWELLTGLDTVPAIAYAEACVAAGTVDAHVAPM